MTTSNERVRSIQALRGVAALMVVIFHYSENKFLIGSAGVQIFFVISGYIMGTIGLKEAPGEFILKRAVRILPLYWVLTLAMRALSFVPGVFAHFKFNPVELLKSLLFIPYYDAKGHIWPILVQGWTLNREIFFYGVFALGLWLNRPLLLCGIVLGIFGLLEFLTWRGVFPNFYFSLSLFEFLGGLALSQWSRRLPAWLGPVLLVAGVVAFGVMEASRFGPTALRDLYWGPPAFAIVAGALIIEQKIGWSPILKPLEHVGDWSFSLYLLHAFPMHLMQKLFGTTLLSALGGIALSIIASVISYHVFERSLSRTLRNKLFKRKQEASLLPETA